jgi:hypothetical protein
MTRRDPLPSPAGPDPLELATRLFGPEPERDAWPRSSAPPEPPTATERVELELLAGTFAKGWAEALEMAREHEAKRQRGILRTPNRQGTMRRPLRSRGRR